jgi:hypothetical protein
MRVALARSARRLTALLVAAVALAPVGAPAQEPAEAAPFEIALEPPARIEVGDRAEVVARVRLAPSAATPMLLTPATEGLAIEVVRGRLTRADGETVGERELRFRIPFVARAAGTAVVRVRLDGFACRDGRCRAVQVEAAIALDVRPTTSRQASGSMVDGITDRRSFRSVHKRPPPTRAPPDRVRPHRALHP